MILSIPPSKSVTMGLALLGAMALFLGFANPYLHLPLLILCYPAVLYILGLRAAHPFRAGWLCGCLGASASLYWIAVAVHDYGYLPWLIAVPCVLILGAYVGLWGGMFAFAVSAMRSLPSWRIPLAAALFWYILEWTRGWFATGFPWLTLAGGQAAWPELIQAVSLVGEYGLSALLALVGCLLAQCLLNKSRAFCPKQGQAQPQAQSQSSCLPPLGTALGVMALLLMFGFWRVHASPLAHSCAQQSPQKGPHIVLVQGNINQNVKWDPTFQQNTLDTYLELSRRALAAEHTQAKTVDLVIWPETSMPFYYQTEAALGQRLRAFAHESSVPLLFGGLGFSRSPGKSKLHNRAFLIGADGENKGFYDKEHLVPFGEYVPPFLEWEIFQSLLSGLGAFTPGDTRPPFTLDTQQGSPPLQAGMLICYEAIFPEIARLRVAQGANLLITISNDAWYNRSSAPVQHLQLSLLRAVEQGRWLARATNTGLTAFVSPLGHLKTLGNMHDGSGLFVEGSLAATVDLRTDLTPYFIIHPYLPALAFLALAIILLPLLRVHTRKAPIQNRKEKP